MMTSGSSRRLARKAAANDCVWAWTSRWVIWHPAGTKTYSIGSSSVMIWSLRCWLTSSTIEASVVEPEIAFASDAPEEIASEDMPAPVAEYARVEEALHEFVAASATRVLEHNTVATLAALVEGVEAERELEPVAPRPAIRMRIGPPRARSAETPDN